MLLRPTPLSISLPQECDTPHPLLLTGRLSITAAGPKKRELKMIDRVEMAVFSLLLVVLLLVVKRIARLAFRQSSRCRPHFLRDPDSLCVSFLKSSQLGICILIAH